MQDQERHLRAREKLDVRVFDDSSYASSFVAQQIIELIRERNQTGPRCKTVRRTLFHTLTSGRNKRRKIAYPLAGRKCVLGLATGSTPMQIYRKLVRE